MWPAAIVRQLFPLLPEGYVAAPGVHLGAAFEIELPDKDEYEVRIYDIHHGRRLVAAIELVSPSNKARPESRRVFVAKIATLLQQDVCVSIVDLVTIRQFNLYRDLLELVGRDDSSLGTNAPSIYAATVRGRKGLNGRSLLDNWFYPMHIGQPLPTLPIWLNADFGVSLNLEAGYEESCRLLRIQ